LDNKDSLISYNAGLVYPRECEPKRTPALFFVLTKFYIFVKKVSIA
jgi:hypothetical protein